MITLTIKAKSVAHAYGIIRTLEKRYGKAVIVKVPKKASQ